MLFLKYCISGAFGVILLFAAFSCSNLKYLPEGEQLYTGSEVKYISTYKLKGKGKINKAVNKALKPKPNSKILGLRVSLWIYNKAGTPKKEKGFKYWLKNKVGEPPVLLSSVNASAVGEIISSKIFNLGFFKSNITSEIIESKNRKKALVRYNAILQKPFIINSIDYKSIIDTNIRNIIISVNKKSLLEKGAIYDLDLLKEERSRLDESLKNYGYYYFSPDFIFYKIDSSSKENILDISLHIKKDVPQKALVPWKIRNIYVTVDSSVNDDNFYSKIDTLVQDSVHFIKLNKDFRPKPIIKSIFMREGTTYSLKNHNMTLSRLSGIGTFKFINIDIKNADSIKTGYLDADIHLSPLPRNSLSLEFQAATKSNNFIGPGVIVGYTNRNLMRGSERLSVNVHGSVETQLTGQYKGLYTYEVGPQVTYTVPKFLIPFNDKIQSTNLYVPTTQFTVDYSFLNRVNYFTMKSLKFSYGYNWREALTKEHRLNPIDITYLKIDNLSSDFQKLLNSNPFLRQRYEDQLVAGVTYSFIYNEQVFTQKQDQFYFNGNIDISGNAISLINIATGRDKMAASRQKFAGVAYSQYARFDIDLRNYHNFTEKKKLVGRLIMGLGLPYGNSTALPYIKGFFAGGPNSLRSFAINSLGPGTYRLPDSLRANYYIQQGGDIKLEANLEYRFPIWGFLRGAFFLDAGNTWLIRKNSLLPGGTFRVDSFLDEIAIGTGTGLRADFNFFVIRLDLGMPLRKPWLQEGGHWVVDKIHFSNPNWRKENFILNIAIGYPF